MAATMDRGVLGALPKKYKVLGDPEDFSEFQQQLQQTEASPADNTPPPPEPEPSRETVHTAQRDDFPDDVWEAATLSPDDGAAVLKSYREVVHLRDMARVHVGTLRREGTNALASASGRNGASLPPLAFTHGTHASSAGMRKTISRQLQETRDVRQLDKFDAATGVWQGVVADLTAKTARQPFELAMERGPEHRHKIETLEALSRALPLQDRAGGPDTWNMSLRGAWERIVPLGSLFSGLFVTIKDVPPTDAKAARKGEARTGLGGQAAERLMKVGRPLDPPSGRPLPPLTSGSPGGTGAFAFPTARPLTGNSTVSGATQGGGGATGGVFGTSKLGRSLTARTRDWAYSQVLATRLDQYAAAIHRNFPYHPDMPSLAIIGQGVAETLASLAGTPVTLGDVEVHMAVTAPDVYAAFCEARQRASQAAERAAAEAAEEAQRAAVASEAALRGKYPGPHAELSAPHLLLRAAAPGGTDTAPLTLTNTGTAALRYVWRRTPAPPATLSPAASEAAPPPAAPPLPCFTLARAEGVLLPGHVHTADVVFSPAAAGVYAESWELVTEPPLEGGAGVSLAVRGLAVPEDATGAARSALDAELAHSEKMRKVHAVLARMLEDVPRLVPQAAAHDHSEEGVARATAEAAFDGANSSAWPPVYFPGSEQYTALSGLYSTARTALINLKAPPVPDEPKKKPPPKGKDAVPEAPPPPVVPYPEVWTGSVGELGQVVAELAQLAPDTAAPMAAQLEAALASQAMRVAGAPRTLLRHAMRAALCRVVDAVAAKLDAVHADYNGRMAEAKAAEEAAAAAGVAPGAAAPAAAMGPTWLADKLRVGAKGQIKNLAATLFEELGRERGAAGEWLEAAIAKLDVSIAAAQAKGQQEGPGGVLEELYWQRYALLREWTRLGVPARGAIH